MLMRTSSRLAEPGNQFLKLLSRDDLALLDNKLERMPVEPGMLLLGANEPPDTIYFPESVIVSIEDCAGGAQHIETALVGYEGLVGWSGLIGGGRSSQRAVVQMKPGNVLGISIGDMASACAASRSLLSRLMRFIGIVMAQMAQAIVSLVRDSIERRICRWLLMRHDRVPGDLLLIRHDEIGGNLGSRRASVTDCLHVLEGERLIRCQRGRIVVRDRPGLELLAGDSYGAAEASYRSLIGPFGRSEGDSVAPLGSSGSHPVRGSAAMAGDRSSLSIRSI